ncbi:hypothetical protein BH24DEI2_BH24DEI2_03470 [soil metagenome]
MNVKVLFFASLREAAGTRQLDLSLDAPTTLRGLAERLERSHHLALSGSLCAVNEHYAAPESLLADGDTVAFFPPVSGG